MDPFERLSKMVAATQEPVLTNEELETILELFAKTDADGVTPTDPEWTPTYNLRAAAREGWKWKMGRAAELQSTDLDGDRMSANQIFEHCERMVKKYSTAASVSTTAAEPVEE